MGTQLPLPKRGTVPSHFQPISVVAKQSPISAIAEHLCHICHYPETGKTKKMEE